MAGDGGRGGGATEAHLRGRVRNAYLPGTDLRLRAQGRAPASVGTHKPRQEHNAYRGDGQPLKAHRPKRIRELIEQQDCELLYLPAYSPNYNPIEEAFAKIKNVLRKAATRSKEALVEAIGAALCAVRRRRRPRLLRACRIPPYGSTTVKRAVSARETGT